MAGGCDISRREGRGGWEGTTRTTKGLSMTNRRRETSEEKTRHPFQGSRPRIEPTTSLASDSFPADPCPKHPTTCGILVHCADRESRITNFQKVRPPSPPPPHCVPPNTRSIQTPVLHSRCLPLAQRSCRSRVVIGCRLVQKTNRPTYQGQALTPTPMKAQTLALKSAPTATPTQTALPISKAGHGASKRSTA